MLAKRFEFRRGGGRAGGERSDGRPPGVGSGLVETVVALAILALLVAIATPVVSSVLAGVQLRSGTTRLCAALLRGRAAALAEGRPWELRLSSGDAFATGPVGGVAVEEHLPRGVVFAGATSGGRVRFSPAGSAENATFVLSASGRERRVVLNQRGRITVE